MSNRPVIENLGKILPPFLVYYLTLFVVMSAAQLVIGADKSHYTVCQIIASTVTIFVVMPCYRSDHGKEEKNPLLVKKMAGHMAAAAAIAILLGMALNNIILMSPLVAVSKGYQEANRNFYGSTLWLEIIGSAILAPVLEELVFRGIIFWRLKKMLGTSAAVPASALLFGVMHFNVVQFIYAFLMGIVFALVMERAGHVCAAVAGHIAANFVAVVRTETGLFSGTVDGSLSAWCISVGLLMAGVVLLLWYLYPMVQEFISFPTKNTKKVD